MYVFYMDDSCEGHNYGFCAIGVPADSCLETFNAIKRVRQHMRNSDGIYMKTELHATDFVGGRGKIGARTVFKGRRCEIFRGVLKYLSSLDQLVLLPALMNDQDRAYERLMNRINATMAALNSRAIIISDRGKEGAYTKLARKMSVYNPIRSRFGGWADGQATKNITTDRIIEDPIFRNPERSYFLQMADFCAFALLRYIVGVPEHRKRYGIHTAFPLLEPICRKQANYRHPLGIIGQE